MLANATVAFATVIAYNSPPVRAPRLAALLCAAACSKGGTDASRQRPPPLVAVAKVTVRDVEETVRAPVDLRPILQAEVGAKTIGYLDAVLVDRGDRVRRARYWRWYGRATCPISWRPPAALPPRRRPRWRWRGPTAIAPWRWPR